MTAAGFDSFDHSGFDSFIHSGFDARGIVLPSAPAACIPCAQNPDRVWPEQIVLTCSGMQDATVPIGFGQYFMAYSFWNGVWTLQRQTGTGSLDGGGLIPLDCYWGLTLPGALDFPTSDSRWNAQWVVTRILGSFNKWFAFTVGRPINYKPVQAQSSKSYSACGAGGDNPYSTYNISIADQPQAFIDAMANASISVGAAP